MRLRIITGGQTGADQGALLAAKQAGIPTGGYAPRGWLTENGAAPWLAEYGLTEHTSASYPARTEANVRTANALIWFGNPHSSGGKLTLRLAAQYNIDHRDTALPNSAPVYIADWLRASVFPGAIFEAAGLVEEITLMVAGNRESRAPGICERTRMFMTEVFGLLTTAEGKTK